MTAYANQFFLQNWADEVVVSTEWQTAVIQATDSLVEERMGLVGKPRRTIKVSWVGVDQAESARLHYYLLRMGHQRTRIPIYCDQAVTTASSSGTTINAPTADRRFSSGGRFVIFTRGGGKVLSAEEGTISSFDATTLTVSALTGTYPAGSIVCPLLDVEILLAGDMTILTDEIGTVSATFSEVHDTSILALETWENLTSRGYSTTMNYYLLTDALDWAQGVSSSMIRMGAEMGLGPGSVVVTRGPRPQIGFKFSFRTFVREDFFNLLAFCDAHRGRLIPFFVENPLTLWATVGVDLGYVDVEPSGDVNDPNDFMDYVSVQAGGSTYLRQVTGVTVQTGPTRWRISLTPDLPLLSLPDVSKVTSAHLVRFAEDEHIEKWATDCCASMDFGVVELVDEREVPVEINP